ncbi:MAG: hypothetical protein Kow0042_18330 [Calditrichia bacterium]
MINRHLIFQITGVLIFLASMLRANPAGGPYLLPEQHYYDVSFYELALSIDIDAAFIQGWTEVAGIVTHDFTDEIILNFYDHMMVDSVRYKNQWLQFNHGNDLLHLFLPQPLMINDSFRVRIYYQGYPMQAGTPGYGLIFTEVANQKLVYSYNWPYFASTFIACKDHPSDKADSVRFRITVPDSYWVACNGKLLSIETVPPNQKTFTWETHYPIVPYNISLNAYPFDVFHSQYYSALSDTIPLEFYLFPFSTPQAKPRLEAVVPQILEAFENRYGAFPFAGEKYGICQSVINGGMEHQTLLIMNNSAFFSDIIVHESAHEYFGNMISISDWGHIWLSEGFATYSEAIFNEYWYGPQVYAQLIAANMAASGEGSIYVYDPSSPGNIIPYNLVYLKASVVLHMLRYLMGDSLFFQMLRDYVTISPFRFKNIDTEQFRQFCETYYGSDLSWFFDQWIYGDGKMAAEYYYYWSEIGPTLNFKIHSIPSAPGVFTYHQMPVPVRFSAFMSVIRDTLWVDSTGLSCSYIFSDTTNLQIEFDPDNQILNVPFQRRSYPQIDSLYLAEDSIWIKWKPFFDFGEYVLKIYLQENGNWLLIHTTDVSGFSTVFQPMEPGLYGFSLAGKQMAHLTVFSPIQSILYTDFPMDQGILLVDETRNGNGANMWNPTDAEVDAFYDSLLSGQVYQQLDILTENRPLTVLDLAPYSLVIWHHDVQNNSFLGPSESALRDYLNAGGKILFSGLKLMTYSSVDFNSQYLGIQSYQLVGEAAFRGAIDGPGFISLPVDTFKITVPFYNHRLPNIMIFDTTTAGSVIYRFDADSAFPAYQDKPCGVSAPSVHDSTRAAALTLGFPLYFMKQDSARMFMEAAIQVLNPLVHLPAQKEKIMRRFALLRAYPNPFNPFTRILVNLDSPGEIQISVYNILGQKVKLLFSGKLTAGEHNFYWDGKNAQGVALSSGIYFIELKNGEQKRVLKLILQR